MTWVCAIDPGKKGGWALFNRDTKELIDAGRLNVSRPLLHLDDWHGCRVILIERAQASSQMGVSSSFEYGRGFGRIEAVALMTGAKVYYCAPVWWKGKLAVPVDKEKAVKVAIRRNPDLARFLKLKSDDGIAEAALMAQILLSKPLFSQLLANNKKREAPKKKRVVFRL